MTTRRLECQGLEIDVMSEKNMEAVEAARARFRPERITTLFVGESAPSGGDFFYYDSNTAIKRYMRQAVEDAFGNSTGGFLERFKSYGWYLDDLVLTPVDDKEEPERNAKCLEAQNSLAVRIAEYQPLAIVSVLLRIQKFVDAAAIIARCNARRFAVPFPGMGQQKRFLTEMALIIPELPR
jgi:hypothetical protein